MSSSAVEQILRILAALQPHGPQYPGKPPKKRDRKRIAYAPATRRSALAVADESGEVIGYARVPCGATQTQTRSVKIGTFQPIDVAGAIGMAQLQPEQKQLLAYIAGESTVRPLLRIDLACELVAQAKWMKWPLTKRDPDRICDLALDMLIEADGCKTCNVTGQLLDATGSLIDCPDCRGSGHVSLSERAIAKAWGIPRTTYQRKYTAPVHWAHRVLQGRAAGILEQLRDAGA